MRENYFSSEENRSTEEYYASAFAQLGLETVLSMKHQKGREGGKADVSSDAIRILSKSLPFDKKCAVALSGKSLRSRNVFEDSYFIVFFLIV